jgi:hypothetical protein
MTEEDERNDYNSIIEARANVREVGNLQNYQDFNINLTTFTPGHIHTKSNLLFN